LPIELAGELKYGLGENTKLRLCRTEKSFGLEVMREGGTAI
jgi:hypothetical protein